MLYTFLLILHVIVSVALILVILAQSSKGGALDGMVGGTASSMLGSQGASDFLKKLTRILAAIFVVLCILLAINVGKTNTPKKSDVFEKMKKESAQQNTATESQDLNTLPEKSVEPVKAEPKTDTK